MEPVKYTLYRIAKIHAAGPHLMFCTDPDESDRGEILIDGELLIYHTLAVVTTEEQLQVVRQQYPHLPEPYFNKYRLAAGLPLR